MASAARIGIVGSQGRMGRALRDAIAEAGAELAGGVDRGGDIHALAKGSDVLLDFSAPEALELTLAAADTTGTPVLIGTTGLEPAHHQLVDRAAEHIAILQTGNTSLGVTLLARLVREAAARLGPDWDIEIVEMHHREKVDAPSGTALLLGQAAAEGRGEPLDDLAATDRNGRRQPGAIGFASLRGGTVAGDHTIIFAGPQERLELSHRAESRAIFARGAVRAALWLIDQVPGRYTMDDVLP